MEESNNSSEKGFLLLGFSDQPQLERILFVIILFFYILGLLGNTAIILVSCLDPKLHKPMYFFLRNLSCIDICFTISVAPQLLVTMNKKDKNMRTWAMVDVWPSFMWPWGGVLWVYSPGSHGLWLLCCCPPVSAIHSLYASSALCILGQHSMAQWPHHFPYSVTTNWTTFFVRCQCLSNLPVWIQLSMR